MQNNTRRKITDQELRLRYNEGHRDFSNIILKNKNLKNADFTGANFSNAILTGTNFKGAKLQHTNFSNAKLKGVDFSHADLTGVNFSQVKASFLDWRKIIPLILTISAYCIWIHWSLWPAVSFSDLLSLSNLSFILFCNTIFVVIPLLVFGWLYPLIPISVKTLRIKTKFDHSNLNGVDFRSAKLEEIDFSKSQNLEKVNFHNASVERANFRELNLEKSDFSRANLTEADFSKANLTEADFSRVKASCIDWIKIIPLVWIISAYYIGINWSFWPAVSFSDLLSLSNLSFILFCNITFIAIPPLLLAWLYSWTPSPFRPLRIRTKFAHSNLNGADFRSAKLEGIDFSRSLNLKNINFHNASLHRANFAGRHLKENNFSKAKLYGTNFSKTKLKQSNFTHSKSGVPFTFGINLLTIIFCSILGFLIAFIPAFSFYFLLESQIINSTSETQEFSIFVYLLIILVGFLHFLCSSVFKDMDEAVIGLGFTALTILLVMTNQPLIIISALVMVLIGIIRIVQIFWKINRFLVVLPPVFLLALCVLILYTYTYIAKSEVIEPIATCLVLLPLLSIRTAVTIAELEIILGWGKWKSVVIVGAVLSIILVLFFVITWDNYNFKEWEVIVKILCLIFASILMVLLGSYLAFRAIEDNPNYRGIRDRSVWLFHLFGRFGTRFRHSDLTCADFSFASLKNADFTNADLTHAVWNGTRQLEYAKFVSHNYRHNYLRYPDNYLRYPQIRQLFSNNFPHESQSIRKLIKIYRHWPPSLKKLIHFCLRERTEKPTKDFKGCDLRGIRLSYYGNSGNHNSFNLTNANFEDADLRGADLRGADLRGVSFVNTQLDEADLSYSDLTDACIQNWQITRKTGLKQVRCQRLQLEKRISKEIQPASQTFNEETILDIHQLQTLLISDEEQEKLDQLKNEFAKLNLIHNKVNRRYHLIQKANNAEASYGIPSELYIQMFELYRKQRIQAQRKQSRWQRFLWFTIEPRIEKMNEWTQELDIFPLLENLGRLSIVFVVITFVNNVLKPDVEKRYRPWEMIHSDTEEFRGVSRFALEQLVQEGANLTYLKVKAEGADLKGINLRGANLSNADFSKAQLNNADLIGANLSNATLTGANLSNAKFGNPSQNDNEGQNSPISRILPPVPQVIKNMQRANLEGANLKGANLKGAILTKANLKGAILTKAKFDYKQIKSACNWRLGVYTKAKLDDEKKIWVPEDEEANQRKIEEIENDAAPDLCSENPTE
ncbi:MAG: pentapeptide repeat-containing protein [Crocosphaera sp.]|nr:pentapeptide repeat-containing protein [Crocosphaera sp.]